MLLPMCAHTLTGLVKHATCLSYPSVQLTHKTSFGPLPILTNSPLPRGKPIRAHYLSLSSFTILPLHNYSIPLVSLTFLATLQKAKKLPCCVEEMLGHAFFFFCINLTFVAFSKVVNAVLFQAYPIIAYASNLLSHHITISENCINHFVYLCHDSLTFNNIYTP